MSRPKPVLVLAVTVILSRGAAHPQSTPAAHQPPSALTGNLTGMVVYGETRLPARFAEIEVVPIPPRTDEPRAEDQAGVAEKPSRRIQRISGASGMDGAFRLDVPEGDYFVAALKPGYLVPGGSAGMDFSLSEAQLESVLASIPQVHVQAGQTANITLTLHRGAVISGRVKYADGSPVIGATLECESLQSAESFEILMRPENRGRVASPRQEALQALSSSERVSRKAVGTDDEGRFRIAGLSSGKYVLNTAIVLDHTSTHVAMNDGSNAPNASREHLSPELIPVYAPAAFRRAEAKVYEVHADEQIADADLTIDPSGLHTLRGRLLAGDDHHAPSQALVRLKEKGTKSLPRMLDIESDGTFEASYLPSGIYVVQIFASDQSKSGGFSVPPVQYKLIETPVVIADQDIIVDDILLVRLKPGETNHLEILF